MSRRFQFSLKTLFLLTTAIGLLFGAEIAPTALAEPLVGPDGFIKLFAVIGAAHVAMSFFGWMAFGWAVGMSTRKGLRYALYGACIATLLIVGRVGWFLSNPSNFPFPSQGWADEMGQKNMAARKAAATKTPTAAPAAIR